MNLSVHTLYQKYKSMSQPLRAVIWFMLCNIIVKGINFVSTPLFANILPITEFGKLALYTSYEQLLIVIATWEVSIGPYQRGLFKYKDDVPLFTASTIFFANIVTLITFTFIILFFDEFKSLTEFSDIILYSFLIFLLLQPAYNCWFYRKRVNYEYRQTVMATIAISAFSIIVPYVALLFLPQTAEVKFFYTIMPSGLLFLFLYIVQINKVRIESFSQIKQRVLKYWHFLISFTPPLVIHAISFYLLGQSDRIMIAKMDSKENAAIYSVAYTISSMAIIVQSALQQVLLPWIYKNLESKRYLQINDKSIVMFVVMSVCYFLFILISPDIVFLLFPHEYHECIWCIPPIAIGSYFMFFYSIFVNVESYYEETRYVAYISVSCSILNIALNYYGIKWFGYVFCAYTTLFCYLLFALGHYYFMNKTLRTHCGNLRIFKGSQLLLIAILTIVFMFVIVLAYSEFYLRLLILLFMLSLIITNFKRLKNLVTQMRYERD
jgi:O-antigen/teichoic acid export membrane protein